MLRFFGPSGINWLLGDGTYTIGRSPQCDLVIADDTVSRTHARLIISNSQVTLSDLESRNGTFANSLPLNGATIVSPGDTLSFGTIEVTVAQESENHDIISSPISEPTMIGLSVLPISEALGGTSVKISSAADAISAISELGKMLVTPESERDMFENALSLIGKILPFDRVGLFMRHGENDELILAASKTRTAENAASFNISKKISSVLLNEKSAVYIRDIEGDQEFSASKSIVSEGIKSAIAVPLLNDNKVLGALYIDISRKFHYEESHLPLMAIFANILAAKITNHRLLLEARDKELMESELKAASQIQSSLLPREIPAVPGYEIEIFHQQSRHVGGDLYDIHRLSEERVLFLLADVSGKGMGAALLASNILGSFRAFYDLKDFNLYEAVCAVSKQLLHYHRPGDYATLFAAILDHKNNTLEYINAGHNPPIVAHTNGTKDDLQATGIPVGLLEFTAWQSGTVELSGGDLFLAYTDGITEAANSNDEFWGAERLEKHVMDNFSHGPSKLLEMAMLELGQFTTGVPLGDDITMIAFRRN